MSPSSARMLAVDVPAVRMRWLRPDAVPRPDTVPSGGRKATGRTAGQPLEGTARLSLTERVAEGAADGYARGLAEGQRLGDEAATARTEAIVRRLVETIDGIGVLRADMMRRTERDLVRLAITMAERIVRCQIEADPDTLLDMARLAIARLGEDVAATVHLNPADHDAATAQGRLPMSPAHIQVVADPQVAPGGCLVRSAFGIIEVGVPAQLQELSRGMLGESAIAEGGHDGDDTAR